MPRAPHRAARPLLLALVAAAAAGSPAPSHAPTAGPTGPNELPCCGSLAIHDWASCGAFCGGPLSDAVWQTILGESSCLCTSGIVCQEPNCVDVSRLPTVAPVPLPSASPTSWSPTAPADAPDGPPWPIIGAAGGVAAVAVAAAVAAGRAGVLPVPVCGNADAVALRRMRAVCAAPLLPAAVVHVSTTAAAGDLPAPGRGRAAGEPYTPPPASKTPTPPAPPAATAAPETSDPLEPLIRTAAADDGPPAGAAEAAPVAGGGEAREEAVWVWLHRHISDKELKAVTRRVHDDMGPQGAGGVCILRRPRERWAHEPYLSERAVAVRDAVYRACRASLVSEERDAGVESVTMMQDGVFARFRRGIRLDPAQTLIIVERYRAKLSRRARGSARVTLVDDTVAEQQAAGAVYAGEGFAS